MYKVGICGHFGGKNNFADGQTIKTKVIYESLISELGSKDIYKVDTYNWRKRPIRLFFELIKLINECESIIVLTAHNGVKVFIPIFSLLNIIFKRRIYYSIIGGWLPSMLKNNAWIIKFLTKFNIIFPETTSMAKELNSLGINNTEVIPNFKNISSIDKSEIEEILVSEDNILKICTFSRVIKEKGIEDIISQVDRINKLEGRIIYKLDIYGQISDEYREAFNEIINKSESYIEYKGIIEAKQSTSIIKNYFMLVFPTRYETEGIPGTIIDSYCAGVPVLASRWNSWEDIIEEGVTGVTYEIFNNDDLYEKLFEIYINPQRIINMKYACVNKSKEFDCNNIIRKMLKVMEINYYDK